MIVDAQFETTCKEMEAYMSFDLWTLKLVFFLVRKRRWVTVSDHDLSADRWGSSISVVWARREWERKRVHDAHRWVIRATFLDLFHFQLANVIFFPSFFSFGSCCEMFCSCHGERTVSAGFLQKDSACPGKLCLQGKSLSAPGNGESTPPPSRDCIHVVATDYWLICSKIDRVTHKVHWHSTAGGINHHPDPGCCSNHVGESGASYLKRWRFWGCRSLTRLYTVLFSSLLSDL